MVTAIYGLIVLLEYMNMYFDSLPTWCKALLMLIFFVTYLYALHEETKLEDKIKELETKIMELQPYFTPEDVRKMSEEEVRKNYTAIMKSMEKWN